MVIVHAMCVYIYIAGLRGIPEVTIANQMDQSSSACCRQLRMSEDMAVALNRTHVTNSDIVPNQLDVTVVTQPERISGVEGQAEARPRCPAKPLCC